MNHYQTIDYIEGMLLSTDSAASRHAHDCAACSQLKQDAEDLLIRSRSDTRSAVGEKPEYFWSAQRDAVSRKILLQARDRNASFSIRRIAAVVVFSVGLGTIGSTVFQSRGTHTDVTVANPSHHSAITSSPLLAAGGDDLWNSEELKDFGPVVAWEEWHGEAAPGDSL